MNESKSFTRRGSEKWKPEHDERGLIKAEWKTTENNRRARYYGLSKKGHKRLANEIERWRQHTSAVAAFLEFT